MNAYAPIDGYGAQPVAGSVGGGAPNDEADGTFAVP